MKQGSTRRCSNSHVEVSVFNCEAQSWEDTDPGKRVECGTGGEGVYVSALLLIYVSWLLCEESHAYLVLSMGRGGEGQVTVG